MSRARNIKPGFFKNDLLAECEPLARILFSGLWCEADRAGRLEDRPRRLKAELLPYDDCDIDGLLDQLAARGFIIRYAHESARYISIPEFCKHQNPHVKESASTIPAPDKNSASTVQVQVPEHELPCASLADSPSLIPDSPSPAEEKKRRPQAAALKFIPPEWIKPEVWAGFVEMRKKGRWPLTDRACALICTELIKLRGLGNEPNAVLDRSTRNGWRDVYELKYQIGSNGGSGGKLGSLARVEANCEADRQREAELFGAHR